jgi:hypothetical protein
MKKVLFYKWEVYSHLNLVKDIDDILEKYKHFLNIKSEYTETLSGIKVVLYFE